MHVVSPQLLSDDTERRGSLQRGPAVIVQIHQADIISGDGDGRLDTPVVAAATSEPPTRRAFIVVRLGEDIDSIRTCEEEEEPWQRQQLRCQQSVQCR
ncbi:Hypp9405 [Branchiostoma lanceolatum]|uniref:Hypp9405 protein n=1 Tax=Branchiostoma lanceolatum TaxID=7740 RepID=A0A8S4MM16_BRALA|nr:Hypp9405 [Branchiostoma lanceolatum]